MLLVWRRLGFFWQFLCEEGFGEFAEVGGALAEGAFAIAFGPKLQGDLGVVDAGIVADAKAYVGAAAIAVAANEADGGACFHGLTGLDKGAVFFEDAILGEGTIPLGDLDVVPIGSGGGAGVVLGVADVDGGDDAATRGVDGITHFCAEANGIAAVLAAGDRPGSLGIGDDIGLGLEAGHDRQQVDKAGVDDGAETAFAIAAFVVELYIVPVVKGGDREEFVDARFYFGLIRERMIGFGIVERGKVEVQDIGAVILVVTSEDISALFVDGIADIDDPLGERGGLQKDDREEQAGVFRFHRAKIKQFGGDGSKRKTLKLLAVNELRDNSG